MKSYAPFGHLYAVEELGASIATGKPALSYDVAHIKAGSPSFGLQCIYGFPGNILLPTQLHKC